MGRSLKLAAIFAYAALQLIAKRPSTRQQRAEWLHQFCVRAIRWMGIAVRRQGPFPERGVVIANHLGYLDVIAFAALHRCVFIGKSEIRRWPLLGWMSTMAGTLYVHRGRGGSAERAKKGMQRGLGRRHSPGLLSRGHSSLGDTVLPFHSGLLAQAMEAGQPITAAYIRYRLTQDNGPNRSLADVCFWDDTLFARHVFRLLALRGIEVELRFAESPIAFSPAAADRRIAAQEARAAVMQLRATVEAEALVP